MVKGLVCATSTGDMPRVWVAPLTETMRMAPVSFSTTITPAPYSAMPVGFANDASCPSTSPYAPLPASVETVTPGS